MNEGELEKKISDMMQQSRNPYMIIPEIIEAVIQSEKDNGNYRWCDGCTPDNCSGC